MVQKTAPSGMGSGSRPSPGSGGVKRSEEAATARERLEAVRVWLLGGFQVAVGSRTIGAKQWRLRKAAILVKVLALAPMRRLPRERVMELLWPGFGKEAASNNLRQTLHAARKAFDAVGGSRYLESEEGSLVLCPENILWVDVEAFEDATLIARRFQSPAAYRAALDLYGGELLPDDPSEEWAEARREALRQLYLALLIELAGLNQERADNELAVETLRRAVAEEPTNEAAHAGLMRVYAQNVPFCEGRGKPRGPILSTLPKNSPFYVRASPFRLTIAV
jgi:DNA-binding SARP family transcriptional activator